MCSPVSDSEVRTSYRAVLMSVTDAGCIIQQNFSCQRLHDDAIQYLNPREIFPYLQNLLDEDKKKYLSEILAKTESEHEITRTRCSTEFVEAIEKLVKERGLQVYYEFLQCIKREERHMGHKYIVSILNGEWEKIHQDPVVKKSQCFKEIMEKNLEEFQDGLNLNQLLPYLIKEGLLTDYEQKQLTPLLSTHHEQEKLNMSRFDRFYTFIDILNTKGPKAHFIFAQCLKEEEQHPTHNELYEKFFSNEGTGIVTESDAYALSKSRKRKLSENFNDVAVVKVSRNDPESLDAELPVSESYFKIVTDLRKMHLMGNWEEAEQLLCISMTSVTLNDESKIGIMLESCTGFINRGMKEMVFTRVEKAKLKINNLDQLSDSVDILLARCEWVLAKLFRYIGDIESAQTCIQIALSKHFDHTKAGEDTALAHYCYASILLEKLALKFSVKEANDAKKHLKRAIIHASKGDFGLDLSHPHMRLAQLCLGSSPTRPGFIKDCGALGEAEASLDQVKDKYEHLAPRTKCIFHLTKSDLCRNKGQLQAATESATIAIEIAKENGFKTEMKAGELRLASIKK